MENTINIGIDLGTTNSAIAKFVKGEIIIFNNPSDYGRSTLPSVVTFRKDKIIVGTKAKEFFEKDPKSTVGVFKRKMGTTESFKIKSIEESRSPIELSALVLKELKTFLPPTENLDAAVITIPASFDMIQSNATKEAGYKAGFKHVVLLQEPIAASLAYANAKKQNELSDGQWLVYDLGGGTFDVALIRIKDGDMKVVDHEGDNYLGGADFDRLIVEKLIIPKLEEKYSFENLAESFKSASSKLNGKYYGLLKRAEDAKITLSSKTSDEIEVSGFEDEGGVEVDEVITVTRSEFNDLIKEYIDASIEMVRRIMTRNSLKPYDLQFVLMVGGSTYIPFVRQRVEEVLQIPVNCQIDPTTAVAVGAAYYAATKRKDVESTTNKKTDDRISIKTSYSKLTKDKEALFSAKITGDYSNLFYRITREDGGFDSGLKRLVERISEDLPLLENSYNFFNFVVYDELNNVVPTNLETIEINSGFGIAGQPLPEDISLEIDDDDFEGETRLLPIFQKGTILPTKRSITRVLLKSIVKGSEEAIRINILEGPHTSLPEANKSIGFIEISGRQIARDVSKGSDIEFSFSISESRDLTVSAYLNMADQEFRETFNPKPRNTPVHILKIEIESLQDKIDEELEQATADENYEKAKDLASVKREINDVHEEAETLSTDDVTDKRYQLEDKKRKIAQTLDKLTQDKRINTAKENYNKIKDETSEFILEVGNDHDQKIYADLVNLESSYLSSNSVQRIEELTAQMNRFYWTLWRKHPQSQRDFFAWLKSQKAKTNDSVKADALIKAGEFTSQADDISKLCEINYELLSLMPKSIEPPIKGPKVGF